MRQRTFSRWIPLAYCVAPHQFQMSDELQAVAGPFWNDQEHLLRFVARVVEQTPDSWEPLFASRTEGNALLFEVVDSDDWRRSLREAKLWTLRIPALLVEQAKWADLLEWYDTRKTAHALHRLICRTPGPPAALTEAVQSCCSLPPSAAVWSSLEQAVRSLLAGGWLSVDEVHASLSSSKRDR